MKFNKMILTSIIALTLSSCSKDSVKITPVAFYDINEDGTKDAVITKIKENSNHKWLSIEYIDGKLVQKDSIGEYYALRMNYNLSIQLFQVQPDDPKGRLIQRNIELGHYSNPFEKRLELKVTRVTIY
jgi:hypothetical protein